MSKSEMKRQAAKDGGDVTKFGTYWICDTCAKEKGGTFKGGACTMVRGDCAYCKSPDQMLTPCRDFYWEKGKWPNEL